MSEPDDPRRQRAAAWIAAALAVALHLWGLYAPALPDPGPLAFPGLDKLAHVLLFALPTWALLRAVRTPWVPLVLMAVHVPVSEWVQATYLQQRSGDAWDAVADVVGIAVGAYLWWSTERARR